MKIFVVSLFSLLILSGCSTEDEYEPHVPKKEAVELNKQAMKIAVFEEGYNEKVDSAIILLQEAVKLDSLYITARTNIVLLANQNNDIDLALKTCHDLQRISPNSPMFLEMEGVILKTRNQEQKAKKIFKKALSLYENELYDELDEDPNLEFSYITCLVYNNQKQKARTRLEALKAKDNENPFYNEVTFEEILKDWNEMKKR